MPQRRTTRSRSTAPSSRSKSPASPRKRPSSSHKAKAPRPSAKGGHVRAAKDPVVQARTHGVAPTRRDSDQGKAVTLPGGREVVLTRRHFLYGAAGAATLALLGGATSYAAGQADGKATLETLTVAESSVFSSNDLEKIEDPDSVMTKAAEVKLPYGTLLWSCDDAVAACLLPTDSADPLTQIGLLSLESATCTTVLENAVGSKEGFQIYDVRANSHGAVWVEADILDNLWRVYGATVKGEKLGKPQLLDEGDGNWEMPTLAAADSYGFWQCLPNLDGEARVENSLIKRAKFGTADVEVIYESEGRMACPLTSTGDGVVAAPRARTGGTYYQLTLIDGASGQAADACVLPSSMSPFLCGYGKTGFSFAFEGIYNYGGGIANLGTYLPMEKPDKPSLAELTAKAAEEAEESGSEVATEDLAASKSSHFVPLAQASESTEAYSGVGWFHFARNPLCAPAWCDDWLVVKSQGNVVAVDLANKKYVALELLSGCDSYGDYLASTDAGKRFVTYSNVNYLSLEGADEKYCAVRIWEKAAG